MRTHGIFQALKDLIFFLVALGIIIIVSIYVFPGKSLWGSLLLIFGGGLLVIKTITLLAALGGTLLFDTSYQANKEKYKMNVSPFTEDKTQSFINVMKVSTLATFGILALPFVLLFALFHIKELFNNNIELDIEETRQVNAATNDNENDPRHKTDNKKWLVKKTMFEQYFFHTELEALEFIEKHSLYSLKPEKLIF